MDWKRPEDFEPDMISVGGKESSGSKRAGTDRQGAKEAKG